MNISRYAAERHNATQVRQFKHTTKHKQRHSALRCLSRAIFRMGASMSANSPISCKMPEILNIYCGILILKPAYNRGFTIYLRILEQGLTQCYARVLFQTCKFRCLDIVSQALLLSIQVSKLDV